MVARHARQPRRKHKMFSKLSQFYKLFTVGHQVCDPAFWKKGQAVVQPIIATLIMLTVVILKGFGYDLPISDDLAFTIAGAIFFVVNSALTIITSKHVGLPAKREDMPSIQQATDESNRSEAMPSEYVDSTPNGGIDEETRERAKRYVEQASANGLGRPEA